MTKFLCLLTVLFSLASANAMTLKEQKKWADWQKTITDPKGLSKRIKDKCGVDIPITLDEKFVTPFMEANTSAPGYCDETRGAMARMCENEISKKAIVAKIKAVKCIFGKEKELDLKINNGTLEMTVGLHTPNIYKRVTDYLENNL